MGVTKGCCRNSKNGSRTSSSQPLLVAFFGGAFETWKRFTSEFAPGGLIDEATAEEKALAWMPATNDVNEGALGSFCVLMQHQPQLTLLQYNAQAMFYHNNTQAFMEKNFQDEDYKFIHKMVRESRGEERKRREELVQHAEAKVAKKADDAKKRKARAAAVAQKIAGIKLILDKEQVVKLSLYLTGDWKPIQTAEENVNSGSESGEEIEMIDHLMEEDNSDWEDVTE